MGHINFSYQNFQVTDTPGLLCISDEERNNLEKLTLAVLTHLPTAALYVHDLTRECGTSVSDQFVIYKKIKERKEGPDGAIRVLVKSSVGVDELKTRVHEMLASKVKTILSQNSSDQEQLEETRKWL
ncbi:OLC1v1014826C1 [Oldenlandia corymbosa var. corymbosa]|uniref:OLC1v1014826C1 n=1 Tax=Oldenlandia corymbosa var. corymbosa TaxID=529605 RepID=A0AAV1E3Z1_OLDCO|nr:OLC1v1014826C1 [Oldenlandia corymbosa var. corymbosa]